MYILLEIMFEVFNYYLTIQVFKYFSTLHYMIYSYCKFQDVGRRNVVYMSQLKYCYGPNVHDKITASPCEMSLKLQLRYAAAIFPFVTMPCCISQRKHLLLWDASSVSNCVTMTKLVTIGDTVAEICRFRIFGSLRQPPCCNGKM